MTDKERILAEIERLQGLTMDENKNFYSEAAEGEYNALCNIEHFINSLQEEPVSEDLEEAAEEWAKKRYGENYMDFPDEYRDKAIRALLDFKAGAKWKEQQMMEKAVDFTIVDNNDVSTEISTFPYVSLGREGDNVKLIVIKQE